VPKLADFPPALAADFVLGAAKATQFPAVAPLEIAFLGRSNCGKSSLINKFLGRRGLARVSGTPGRTREINFFRILFRKDSESFLVADLPGYGYARAPRSQILSWKPLVEGYLKRKRNQKAYLLMDIRRDFAAEESLIVSLLQGLAIPVTVVATKRDKLKKGAEAKRAAEIRASLPEGVDLLLFSSLTGEGRREFILDALSPLYPRADGELR
jgi:GTP-binding protein